ncbi:MAG TPA: methionyl-tRNA formyltransferase [Desulfobacteria bacterium]|nr:methionyl-tRNA formyltransferase [Desulfobacteria bacterium]
MRVVFMGTPAFAVPCLDVLLDAGHQVLGVVTQPDRPQGRGRQQAYSAVKTAALQAGLNVLQPYRVKDPEFIEKIRSLAPELIVVVAYGQVLPPDILTLPPLGCINVHASLLPKYRGAAPIHWVVINGEEKTGVTTMYMDAGLDTGDMLLKREIAIGAEETVGSVHDRLAGLGSRLLIETLAGLSAGTLRRLPQDNTHSTYAPMLTREHERIVWQNPAAQVHNQVRGMNPWPGAYTVYNNKLVKVWETEIVSTPFIWQDVQVGTVVNVDKHLGFTVQTGNGQLLVKSVQPQGSKKMPAAAFARGYGLKAGDKLN